MVRCVVLWALGEPPPPTNTDSCHKTGPLMMTIKGCYTPRDTPSFSLNLRPEKHRCFQFLFCTMCECAVQKPRPDLAARFEIIASYTPIRVVEISNVHATVQRTCCLDIDAWVGKSEPCHIQCHVYLIL